jgi:hypothetical protein
MKLKTFDAINVLVLYASPFLYLLFGVGIGWHFSPAELYISIKGLFREFFVWFFLYPRSILM